MIVYYRVANPKSGTPLGWRMTSRKKKGEGGQGQESQGGKVGPGADQGGQHKVDGSHHHHQERGGGGGFEEDNSGQLVAGHREAEVAHQEAEVAVRRIRGGSIDATTSRQTRDNCDGSGGGRSCDVDRKCCDAAIAEFGNSDYDNACQHQCSG